MSELPSSPSTRRTLAARLPGPLGALADRLRRAVERGDARLALVVGVPVALLMAWAFAADWWLAPGFEAKVLDQAFLRRSPIAESDRILMVDMNEETFKLLRVGRNEYAGVLLALHRLGVRRTVFDVEFKMVVPRPRQYDIETGQYLLRAEDVFLRDAIAVARSVTLSFHFDLAPFPEDLRRAMPLLRDALSKKFTSGPEELARASGLPIGRIRPEFEAIFQQSTQDLVRERLERNPSLAFGDLRKEFLPGDAAIRESDKTKVLQYSYWAELGIREMASRVVPVRVEGVPPRLRRPESMVLPMVPFLQGADSISSVNADADPDGVLRRPWTAMMFRGKPCLYLGLEGVIRGLAGEGEVVETILRERELRIEVKGKADGAVRRSISLPIDQEGRVLVDWAGNATRRRGGDTPYFHHLPFHDLLGFFEERYLNMDSNFKKLIAAVTESSGEPYHPEYAALSGRLSDFLSGKGGVPPAEFDEVEGKMEVVRLQVLAEIEAEAAEIEKALPTLKSQRAKDSAAKELAQRRSLIAGLRSAYDYEKRLRPLVEGKIAWIGSASTAGGDLHSLPLGIAMPGVDVPASVANMVLTGQTLRRVPRAIDFLYVLAVGLAVSWSVTRWGTMTAALPLTVAVSGLSLGIYAALFTGSSIVLSGAGPLAQAGTCFALVAGFKELVTQRSKRKLQKELERSTSPEMVKILMEHPEFLSKPRSVTGSFLFSDVKGFTSISEKMTPDVLFPFINRMLDTITQALKARQAYIDKYVGDGVVALFGAPVVTPEHARNACLAALDCQVRLKALNGEFAREGLPQIRVRIGVNSGDVKAGNMGAIDRSSYTVMGDPINLASRLEGANKSYDTYIMIGEQTLEIVRGQFVVRELDRIRVVGKKLPVSVYELIAVTGDPVPFPQGFLEGYDAALKLFQARRWREAIDAFEALLRVKPGDKPCENYVQRAGEFLVHPPPADQEIVFELHSK